MPSSRLWRQLSPGLVVAQYSECPVRVSALVTDLDTGTDKAAAQAKVCQIEGSRAGWQWPPEPTGLARCPAAMDIKSTEAS